LRTVKAVSLFVVGLFLALLTFPVAFYTSFIGGCVLGVIAVLIGAYLIAKRGGRTLPLVLGIVLLILAVLALIGTVMIYVGAWTLSEALKEVTKVSNVTGSAGAEVKVGSWVITVVSVKEGRYVNAGGTYYSAKDGWKVVLVELKVMNTGSKTKDLSDFWKFTLVTNAGKSYERVYPIDLKPVFMPSKNIREEALTYNELSTTASVVPGTYVEGDILFQIPVNEEPEKLYFKVGIIGGHEVTINLKQSS